MSFTIPNLIDTSITPNPWAIVAGDVYQRPTPTGWDRVVVLDYTPPSTRPDILDVSKDVPVPDEVGFIDPLARGTIAVTSVLFRARLAAYDFQPHGRMRTEPPAK